MTRVTKSNDCGNSPKNRLLQDFTIAVARADATKVHDWIADDVRWLPVGGKPIVGADAVAKAMTKYGPASVLGIEHVVSHGRAGAVDGSVEFGSKRRAFCHVFELGNARGSRIKAITTYSLPLR